MTDTTEAVECPWCKGKGEAPRVVVDVWTNAEEMASIYRGLADVKAGRVVPWAELRRKYVIEDAT